MVLIYILRCGPFSLLSNGVLYLATHAFAYELQVEIYLICPAYVANVEGDTSRVAIATLILHL